MVNVTVMNFLFKEINLVKKQDDWYPLEYPVVDNGVENVPWLLDPIGFPILQQDLIILRGGGHKQNARHRLETLEPFLSLCPLTSNINKKKRHTENQKINKCSLKDVQLLFLPGYVNPALYHPLGCLPGVEDVLQGGHVLGAGHSLQAVKEILDRVSQLILVSPVKSSLDTLVRPQLVQHRLKAWVRYDNVRPPAPSLGTLNCGKVVLLRLAVMTNNNNWSPNISLSLLLRGIFSFFCASTNTFMP